MYTRPNSRLTATLSASLQLVLTIDTVSDYVRLYTELVDTLFCAALLSSSSESAAVHAVIFWVKKTF